MSGREMTTPHLCERTYLDWLFSRGNENNLMTALEQLLKTKDAPYHVINTFHRIDERERLGIRHGYTDMLKLLMENSTDTQIYNEFLARILAGDDGNGAARADQIKGGTYVE